MDEDREEIEPSNLDDLTHAEVLSSIDKMTNFSISIVKQQWTLLAWVIIWMLAPALIVSTFSGKPLMKNAAMISASTSGAGAVVMLLIYQLELLQIKRKFRALLGHLSSLSSDNDFGTPHGISNFLVWMSMLLMILAIIWAGSFTYWILTYF